MLPFCLYFAAALVTAFHLYTLLALAVYGVPIDPFELVALLGSLALLLAAYVSLFKPNLAARIALLACIAIWSFYAPALANAVRTKFHEQRSMSVGRPMFPAAHRADNSPLATSATKSR